MFICDDCENEFEILKYGQRYDTEIGIYELVEMCPDCLSEDIYNKENNNE